MFNSVMDLTRPFSKYNNKINVLQNKIKTEDIMRNCQVNTFHNKSFIMWQ